MRRTTKRARSTFVRRGAAVRRYGSAAAPRAVASAGLDRGARGPAMALEPAVGGRAAVLTDERVAGPSTGPHTRHNLWRRRPAAGGGALQTPAHPRWGVLIGVARRWPIGPATTAALPIGKTPMMRF